MKPGKQMGRSKRRLRHRPKAAGGVTFSDVAARICGEHMLLADVTGRVWRYTGSDWVERCAVGDVIVALSCLRCGAGVSVFAGVVSTTGRAS